MKLEVLPEAAGSVPDGSEAVEGTDEAFPFGPDDVASTFVASVVGG